MKVELSEAEISAAIARYVVKKQNIKVDTGTVQCFFSNRSNKNKITAIVTINNS